MDQFVLLLALGDSACLCARAYAEFWTTRRVPRHHDRILDSSPCSYGPVPTRALEIANGVTLSFGRPGEVLYLGIA